MSEVGVGSRVFGAAELGGIRVVAEEVLITLFGLEKVTAVVNLAFLSADSVMRFFLSLTRCRRSYKP